MKRTLVAFLVTAALFGGRPALSRAEPPAARDEASPAALATELARLRGEAEELSAELELRKESHRARLRSLAAQKAEIELEFRREELRLEQLRKAAEEQRQRNAQDAARRAVLLPAVHGAAEALRTVIRAGLPFHTKERLAEVDRIVRQTDEGLITPHDAVARLWDRVEDEIRLARESGLYKQVVTLRSGELLAEVARLGMVMLFFRTPEGAYGRAVREAEGWRYALYHEEPDTQHVAHLFDAFKKQIRVGFFELPNALAEMTP